MYESYYNKATADLVRKLQEFQILLNDQKTLLSFITIDQLPANVRLWEKVTFINDRLIGDCARYIRHLEDGELPL